ncbi:hypothetical protein F9C11_26510 [Amycolatopsis sp. VS8301801F10]|uniref:hypothetical protein n=1 Tax=Amycolatopsis sp. VS8301801F10 TaxID=2652442 RepID=UPI0038FCCBE9
MIDYRSMKLGELRDLIVAEADQHVPLLNAASAMWTEIRPWLAARAAELDRMRLDLGAAWTDFAGTAFDAEALKVVRVAQSWTDEMAGGPESGGPWTTSTTTDAISKAINGLIGAINGARAFADAKMASLPRDASDSDAETARDAVAVELEGLAGHYREVASQLFAAPGRQLSGDPKVGLASPADQPGPGPAAPNSGGDPDAANPRESPSPQEVPDPDDPAQTPAGDSPESPLETAKNAADVAGKALDLAKNAGGAGGNLAQVPDPVSTAFDPAELYQPADFSPLPQADSGLPGLAGAVGGGAGAGIGGGGVGGPAGAGGGLGGPVSPNAAQSALSAGTPPVGSVTTAGAGTAGSSGMPPMYPPQSGAGRGGAGSGGIRPGAAEQVNAVRSRKADGKTGVVLAGRDAEGKRKKPVPAKARKKPQPAVESAPAEVLDEELWQVGSAGPERSYRT